MSYGWDCCTSCGHLKAMHRYSIKGEHWPGECKVEGCSCDYFKDKGKT